MAAAELEAQDDEYGDPFGIIRMLSILYIGLGLIPLILILEGESVNGIPLTLHHAVSPTLMIVGAWGTLARKKWGRRISYFFSVLMLLTFNLGTIIGWMMIRHLRRHKALFS